MKYWFLIVWCSFSAVAATLDPTCAKTSTTLHKAASAQSPVSWKVGRYMPFQKLEAKNGWLKLRDLEGEVAWAKASDLSGSLSCVVVKSTVANLRQAPAPEAPFAEIRSADRYTPFKRLNAEGEWVHVEDESGHQSWVHETNIWRPVKVQVVNF